MSIEQSFTGTCPTCGQKYCGDEIERLRAVLEFYSDPARWMKKHNVLDEQIPDFYSETNFGERAQLALNTA